MGLTIKQKAFAEYYIKLGKATESYIKAGNKASKREVAEANARKLLGKDSVKKYIKEKMEEIWKELQKASEARRMEEIREIGCGLARKFSLPAVVITGVDHREEGQPLKMGNLVLENGNSSWVFAEKSGGSYSGTGDLFASVLSAGLVKRYSMKTCAELAVDFISASIRDAVEEGTDRNDGVCFEQHLGMLLP